MTQNNAETKQVVSYVPQHLYDQIVTDANRQKRSISAQIHYILDQYYEPVPQPERHNTR